MTPIVTMAVTRPFTGAQKKPWTIDAFLEAFLSVQ